MSEKNVELVRQTIEAINARDTDRALSMCEPGIELHSAVLPALGHKTYQSRDRMLQWRDDLYAVIEDFHMENIQFLDAGDERVVILCRVVGRGAGSGAPINGEIGALLQLRNGKVLTAEVHLDQREALEAAGLSE